MRVVGGPIRHRGTKLLVSPRPQLAVSYTQVMGIVLNWNGEDLPKELQDLPKGRYVVVPVDERPELNAEQEAGLESALASVRAGREVPLDEARQRVDARLRR